jgi:hypothetical protein
MTLLQLLKSWTDAGVKDPAALQKLLVAKSLAPIPPLALQVGCQWLHGMTAAAILVILISFLHLSFTYLSLNTPQLCLTLFDSTAGAV